ncbi:Ppx/GppA phosphatase family protein [Notoacmeibacter sp. MSK16QG-6]|uniref:Ppx/GppA phosphatase family protein n=1 Tax=Notoacmeibacter sp. MSK16QG-6 TaxID=2957982 RepID=UPI00353151C7
MPVLRASFFALGNTSDRLPATQMARAPRSVWRLLRGRNSTVKNPDGGKTPSQRGGDDDSGGPDSGSQRPTSRRGRRRHRSRGKGGKNQQGQAVEASSPAPQPARSDNGAPSAEGGKPNAAEKPRRRRSRRRRRRKNVYAKDHANMNPGVDEGRGSDADSRKEAGAGKTRSIDPSRQGQPVDHARDRSARTDDSLTADAQTGNRREPQRWRSRQVRREGHAPLYAALDLGTNNCRLLMAAPTRPGQFRVVDAFSRIVRLGEGLTHSGRLSQDAMDRAVEALHVCAGKLMARKTRGYRLIATEACRAAENGAAFIERVRRETGLSLEIVDRETEARLAVAGCSSLVEPQTKGVVLFDIGGGSSEIALIDIPDGNPRRLSEKIVSWTSLPMGVVTLAEHFGGRDVTPEVFDAMVSHVHDMISRFEGREGLAHILDDPNFHLLGTSGTVTTLAGIFLDLERYDRRRVDGIWMSSEQVSAMTARLLGWTFEERVENPCIGADRADLVLAGCAILEAIRRTWPSERLRVADRGLREGILMELMTRDNAWRRGRRKGGQQ